MKMSLVIPAKDVNDKKLAELLRSIDAQDFPKDELEVLVITEGTSESAKAIGIRRAKGKVIGILASDNELVREDFLLSMYNVARIRGAAYPIHYHYRKDDDCLNRYFALIGGNDPLSFYMGKNDKSPFGIRSRIFGWLAFGDNGFFIKKEIIEKSDLENYYHADNVFDISDLVQPKPVAIDIWHKTGGNLISFFRKRYKYGHQYAFNKNRRWHLVDFSKPQDIRRFLWFIFVTLTVIEPLYLSIRGYSKVRDVAWFIHPVACFLTLFTYGLLILNLGIKRLSQSLFAPMVVQKA